MWWIESNPSPFSTFPSDSTWELRNMATPAPADGETSRPQEAPIVIVPPHGSTSNQSSPPMGTPIMTQNPGYDRRVKTPTLQLTNGQLSQMWINQGLAAMVLAAAINWAIAYRTFPPALTPFPFPVQKKKKTNIPHQQSTPPRAPPGPAPQGSPPPFLFHPPVSFLADAALSTVLQSVITWFCVAFLVNLAVSRGSVPPYAPRAIPEPTRPFWRWVFMLDHYNAARGSACLGGRGRWCCCGVPRGVGQAVGFFLAGLGRGLVVAVYGFGVMVGPTIGVLMSCGTPYEGDWVFLGRWDGVVFKSIYGGFLALVLGPPLTYMWIVRAGWIVRRNGTVV
ncbi:hypothetical protein NEMBOFW57_008513 [Staphylotrichum longicolle]|uniref:Uncharacterized protein n=1 Tax=Staphylotrichum longicolle TaxID=669026 RepID=A0AAD4EVA5_9PEZI|nr:hypothetical protein NEMBOFW57_008513 [Staphylotrichum longicolle]